MRSQAGADVRHGPRQSCCLGINVRSYWGHSGQILILARDGFLLLTHSGLRLATAGLAAVVAGAAAAGAAAGLAAALSA